MLNYYYFILLVALLPEFREASCDDLLAVTALYRHGDRAPLESYKYDPYDESYWPLGYGQLTNLGKRQQFALGQWFRQTYGDFLPDVYNKSNIKVISSNVDRCLMSASINLAGLYPPKGNQVWNKNLNWQPIPIHTAPEEEDAVLAQGRPCPKYDKLYSDLMDTDEVRPVLEKYKDLFEDLSENSGENVTTFEDLLELYNILYIEDLYNLTLPVWSQKLFTEEIKKLCGFAWATTAYTKDLARLRSGPLVDLIISHFNDVLSNTTDIPKFLMLSAHDNTIASLLAALQVYDKEWPQYTSTVILELRKGDKNNYVNIFYKNPTDVVGLTLPNCDFNCEVNRFEMLLKPVRINLLDWDKECQRV